MLSRKEAFETFAAREYIRDWYAEKRAEIDGVDAATASFLVGQGRMNGRRLYGCQIVWLTEIAEKGGYNVTL